jgi:hypothetical protein
MLSIGVSRCEAIPSVPKGEVIAVGQLWCCARLEHEPIEPFRRRYDPRALDNIGCARCPD